MKKREESAARTLTVAVAVALVCSALVTLAVHFFRPVQMAFASLDRNRAIVAAAYDASIPISNEEVVENFLSLDAVVLDLQTLQLSSRIDGYSLDHWQEPPLESAESMPRYIPIYTKKKGGKLDRLILPIHGKGMWSTIYGYLALESDMNTVSRLVIFQHGETPGIGDRIQNMEWLDGWVGKKIKDSSLAVKIEVTDNTNIPVIYRVDSITGATITSKAVGKIIQKCLGPVGYGPALDNLKSTWGLYDNSAS